MENLTRASLKNYLELKIKEIQSDTTLDKFPLYIQIGMIDDCNEVIERFVNVKGKISKKKLEVFLSSEIDWNIDYQKERKRQTLRGGLCKTEREANYRCRSLYYNILHNFGLKRLRVY